MTFDVRATSADMLSPVHIYDGDEAIAPEVYRKTIYNGYISCVPFLYGAARGYGLDIDSDTFERWKRGTAVKLLRNSVRRLPERRLNELSEHAREIARIAFAKAQTRDIQQYRALLRCEADHTGALPALIVSDYVAGQHRYPRFAAWCQQALRLGTFADHALDLKDDYGAGRTVIKPGVRPRMWLAVSAISAASRVIARPQGGRATASSLLYRGRYSLRFAETFVPRSTPDAT